MAVAFGVVTIGVSSRLAGHGVPLPGPRLLEWALLLPLAMPAYVMAYAYTDFLQFAGPVQTALREATGWPRARLLVSRRALARRRRGDVRRSRSTRTSTCSRAPRSSSVRAALIEAGAHARLRRAGGAFLRVALPLARPAIVGGVALALMETLADYGTVAYFGVQTFTTGIFRAWFSLGDRVAAAQLRTLLLGFVVAAARARARVAAAPPTTASRRAAARPHRLRGAGAAAASRSLRAPRRWRSASRCRRCCCGASLSTEAMPQSAPASPRWWNSFRSPR